jgi:hypothetical protein
MPGNETQALTTPQQVDDASGTPRACGRRGNPDWSTE